MSSLSVLALVLGAVGACCLIAALSQLWAMGGQAEEPVGSLHATRPAPPPPPLVPANFRSLIGGESTHWKHADQWELLGVRLDDIERRLGGDPQPTSQPDAYSAAWLDERIARIETISGPLPSPMLRSVQPPARRRFWKKR